MTDFPYSSDDVDWLRPPEVEGETGYWVSRWLLVCEGPVDQLGTPDIALPVRGEMLAFELKELSGGEIRLELSSVFHPLDPEGYVLVDHMLLWLHEQTGIVSINGSAREKWRTFR